MEAWELLQGRPLRTFGLGLMLIATLGACALPAPLLALLAGDRDALWRSPSQTASTNSALAILQVLVSAAVFALVSAPMLIGLMASCVASSRHGALNLGKALSGFREQPSDLALVSSMLLVAWLAAPIPALGVVMDMLIGLWMWLVVCALAERQRGAADAVRAAYRAIRGHAWPLVLLFLVAALVGLGGLLGCGCGLLVSSGRIDPLHYIRGPIAFIWAHEPPFSAPAYTPACLIGIVGCVGCAIGLLLLVSLSMLAMGAGYRMAADAAGLTPTSGA